MAKVTINIGKKSRQKKPKAPVVWQPIDHKHSFKYDVEVEYNDYKNCDGGCQNDYCRCGTLENIRVTEVNLIHIVSIFMNGSQRGKSPITGDVFLTYALYRVLVHRGIWDSTSGIWDTYAVPGYYGEEPGPVSLDSSEIEAINKFIIENMNVSNTEKIRNALIVEYGYILEALEGKELDNIQKVKVEDIRIGSPDHYTRIDRKSVESEYAGYEEYGMPFGICIDDGDGKYRLVDGYHRITYAKIKGLSKVPMIVVR